MGDKEVVRGGGGHKRLTKDTKEVKGGGRNRNNGGDKNRHSMTDGHMVTTLTKNGVNNEINARQAKMRKRRVTIGTTVHEM